MHLAIFYRVGSEGGWAQTRIAVNPDGPIVPKVLHFVRSLPEWRDSKPAVKRILGPPPVPYFGIEFVSEAVDRESTLEVWFTVVEEEGEEPWLRETVVMAVDEMFDYTPAMIGSTIQDSALNPRVTAVGLRRLWELVVDSDSELRALVES